MADQLTITTSSKSLDEKNNDKKASPPLPKSGKAEMITKLAQNLSERYKLVKQRQQKFNDHEMITTKLLSHHHTYDSESSASGGGDWQEVSAKNKLKRKKKLSASLTSVTDSVNQEKRTRIEGIQLNCRGKLPQRDTVLLTPTPMSNTVSPSPKAPLVAKPPLPPAAAAAAPAKCVTSQMQANTQAAPAAVITAPPRMKRKLQDNVQTIQKLNAQTEQLRLEINELKSNLTTERGAVRVLRAQNESESRKWRNEVKKLQNSLDLSKKNSAVLPINMINSKKFSETVQTYTEVAPNATANASLSLVNYEIQRLTNEITMLKEANKTSEEKKMINCDADRRKAADMRTLKDSYEIRLTQLTKSAKNEISRLLEEIKTKERNIGQLKKDLNILQTKQTNENKSRNATTNPKNTTTNKTTNKPKKTNTKVKPCNEFTPTKKEENKDPSKVQNPNEMKKLKDIELINNSRNLQNNVNLKTTKILTKSQNNILQTLETNDTNNHKNMLNDENLNSLLKTTTTCGYQQQSKEYHSMPTVITEPLMEQATNKNTRKTTTTTTENEVLEYRIKDNNSDSDSAVSSAPPSISPQPPSAGMDTADIWQTIRNIEKLQGDIDVLQKENDQLHLELNLAKQQIFAAEKTALEATNHTHQKQLLARVKYLEEQEHQLQAESNELREQNELLEFRILELEENNDKWSLQSHATPSSASTTSQTATMATSKDVWACVQPNKEDPIQLLFGTYNNNNITNNNSSKINIDIDMKSSHSHHHVDDDLHLMDTSNEELCRSIANMLKKSSPLDEDDRHCLEQLFTLLQQVDNLSSQRSGHASLNTNASTNSSDEASSLDLVKSRISDYSSASSSSSARSAYDNAPHQNFNSKSSSKSGAQTTNSARIVATVQPYNSSPQQQTHQVPPPTNTPNESPRKTRHAWQCNSLSESGVFVESDFLSDASENANVCTQTDFDCEEEEGSTNTKELCSELQRLQRAYESNKARLPGFAALQHSPLSPQLSCDQQKRLQYYKERLELLERKVLIYESSGDLQAKHLADRLQREIQLEKQLNEQRDRVEFLEGENEALEEEKCEFEEAENDTRLRLQRLEVELEILSQRNVELEMSREALSAKYKDCRSECLILRDDLSASETQIRHIEEDKQKAKENFEFLHSTLPLLLIYNTIVGATTNTPQAGPTPRALPSVAASEADNCNKMGNVQITDESSEGNPCERSNSLAQFEREEAALQNSNESCACQQLELHYLKEEVKCLRHQIKQLNSRHYEAMESADSHWVDLEREYKDREEAFRAKEFCLKQKIQKLQDCVRDDARAANEKILQLEEQEKELKCCLLRVSKEHRDILEEHQNVLAEYERFKENYEQLKEQQKPLSEALEIEKKRNKSLGDELGFMRKLQQECDSRNMSETESMRTQLFDLKKEFLHIEVTNSELKEEVATLEHQIESMRNAEKECEDKIRTLSDEVRTKEEMCQKLEKRLERSEGYSLAQELNGSPSKRFKREDVKDLKSATTGLGGALRNMKEKECTLPSHQQFQTVARDVKKLADSLLHGDQIDEDEILQQIEDQLNEQLMKFHSRKMESEFYCTVYYPVKRQLPIDKTDALI